MADETTAWTEEELRALIDKVIIIIIVVVVVIVIIIMIIINHKIDVQRHI